MQGYRLSSQQERLWRFLEAGMPAHTKTVVELRGDVDGQRLERALGRVIGRHEILRTAYRRLPGIKRPVQVVGESCSWAWEELPSDGDADLSGWVDRLLADRPEARPDLEAGPLVRAVLARVDGETNLLCLRLPALSADGATLENLVGELAAEYGNGDGSGAGDTGEEEVVQYLQFSEWQHEVLEEVGPPGIEVPGQADPVLPWELESEGAEPGIYTTDVVRDDLGPEVAAPAAELARRLDVEEGVPLLAAWLVLLGRFTGSDDVVVGRVSHGRVDEALSTAAGLFSRVLPTGTALAPGTRFQEVVEALREPVSESEELVGVAASGAEPVASIGFEYRSSRPPLPASGLHLRILDQRASLEPFKLKLDVAGSEDGLRAAVEYDVARFRRRDVKRLVESFRTLLDQALRRPELPLERLPVVGPGELHELVAEWNRTGAEFPRDRCVHELFEERVRRHADEPAVVSRDGRWTYADLDRRANAVAARLRAAGVGPEGRVGILAERTPGTVAAVLGVFKAGAAYVPLDPASPPERTAYVLSDAGCELVLTQERFAAGLEGRGADLLLLQEELLAGSGSEPGDGPGADAHPEGLAYVLYTSGSTGRPKGTLVSHRAVVNYVHWAAGAYGLAEGRGALLHSPLEFDLTVTGLLAPLVAGQRIVLVPDDESLEPLRQALRAGRDFSLLKLTPSHLAALRPLLGIGDVHGTVRSLVVGGEALHAEALKLWREGGPATRIYNEYGPTEATVGCAVCRVPEDFGDTGRVPIGRPIANARLFVLDGRMEPVPTGAEGELFIGGVGLARGYQGLPSLTAERFVPDPYGGSGERLYRSGDLVRRAGDDLEFLGRRDHQVKIRGQRVELGEIEAVLAEHPGVREAAAALRSAAEGERLVGYYVPEDRGDRSIEDLQEFLAVRLPGHMVPGAFVALDALPVTGRGKLDRSALPAPEPLAEAKEFVAPRTPAEVTLAEIWAEVLGLERVGALDNFFELGGDSILGIQVVAKATAAGLHLVPRQMFQYRTLRDLAAAAGSQAQVPAEQGPVTGEVPLTPVQRWFFETHRTGPHHFNQTVLLETRRPLDPLRLRAALEELSRHHDVLRARFLRQDGGWRQVQTEPPESSVELTTVDLSALRAARGAEAVEAVAAATQGSLDLGRGPLFRAVRMDLGSGRSGRLLLVSHHLVMDGVSWRILLEDLQALHGMESPASAALPPKTTSFQEWARRLEEAAGAGDFDAERDFWLSAAGTEPPPIPLDFPEGSNRVRSARSVRVSLDAGETDRLLHEVLRARQCRIQELLLAAVAGAIRSWTGSPRLLVELEGHGREEQVLEGVDLTRTVGWFTSLYPLAIDLEGAEGASDVLAAVRDRSREVPAGGLGYGVLRYLHPDPEVVARFRELPRPQVAFEYLGQLDQALEPDAPFTPARESKGEALSPEAERPHLLEITAEVAGGRLAFEWSYSEELHRRATVERLARGAVEGIRELLREEPARPPEGIELRSDGAPGGLGPREAEALRDEHDLEDAYPLSPVQEGMLFESLSEDRVTDLYLDQSTCRLEGPLEIDAFRRACEHAVARHPALRTSFRWENLERPLQVVHRRPTLPWQALDWRDLSPQQQAERLEAFLEEDRNRGFDPARGPLLRVTLVRLGEASHQLVWTLHHLVLDGWSLSVLLEEVMESYRELSRGRSPDLPPAPPYRDFIRWLGERAADGNDAEAYWRRALSGFDAPTPLPWTEGAPSPGGPSRLEERTVELSTPLTRSLRAFARRHGLTLATVVEGVWALVLGLAGEHDDVVFGTVVFGRPADLPQADAMVGLFINTLPMRVRIRRDRTVADWLLELQGDRAEQREHQHTDPSRIRRWSEVPPNEPLFSSIVNFLDFEGASAGESKPVQDAGLEARDLRFSLRVGYPLSVSFAPGPERLEARLRYDTSRFGDAAAAQTIRQMTRYLRRISTEEGVRVGELQRLTPDERHQLLNEWARHPDPVAAPPDVVASFERQVESRPSAPALVVGETSLSYLELDRRAGRLAAELRRRGVGPEVRVAILAERSWTTIVALLAVLKAGGAYVPLDPELPPKRRAGMLADCRASLLIASRGEDDGAAGGGLPVLPVDADEPAADAEEAPRAAAPAEPETLAYVLFTSGSTGRPKGVAVARGQIASYVHAVIGVLGLEPGRSFATVSTLAADLGNTSIFGALCSGGCLHVLSQERSGDPEAMAEYMDELAVDGLKIVPSHLSALLGGARPEAVLPRRWLVSGGETLYWGDVERIRCLAPDCSILNHYGPTEATVGASVHRVDGADGRPAAGSVPIGRPLANSSLYVLDPGLEPVVPGRPGELSIGGDGVVRGYWGQPGATAASFLPDPYAGQPGRRLYRTGDRVRHDADGSLVFVGRRDLQVKIRGHRVEPGEIERALHEHPGVRDAVVLADSGDGGPVLTAYVTPRAGSAEPSSGHCLPNGLVVHGQNPRETEALYDEIFVRGSYLHPELALPERPVVFDVGANIGMFSLFVGLLRPGARVFAFEPIPGIYDDLVRNAGVVGAAVEPRNVGLSDRSGPAEFTYVPRYSQISGLRRYVDLEHEVAVVTRFLENQRSSGHGASEGVLDEAGELLPGWLQGERVEARVERLSDVLRREGIDRIDLLKVDAQGAECEVLAGIDEDDWPRIGQILLEVHGAGDGQDRVEVIRGTLEEHGYRVWTGQDELMEGTDRFNLYARRTDLQLPRSAAPDLQLPSEVAAPSPGLSPEALRAWLRELLPKPMVPAGIVLLDSLPTTPNGKVDRGALRDIGRESAGAVESPDGGEGPRSSLERDLAELWQELLGRDPIGIHDDFFNLGGHSLLAMQLISRLRRRFDVELSLRAFLEAPTIAGLSVAIARESAADLDADEVEALLDELEEG